MSVLRNYWNGPYCIREMVRTVESLPMLSLMPDGCDVHDSRNYNKGTPEYVAKVYTMLQNARLAPPGVDDQWRKTQWEAMQRQATFIIRELWVTGVLWPDFNRADLLRGIIEYQRRDRRFGGR